MLSSSMRPRGTSPLPLPQHRDTRNNCRKLTTLPPLVPAQEIASERSHTRLKSSHSLQNPPAWPNHHFRSKYCCCTSSRARFCVHASTRGPTQLHTKTSTACDISHASRIHEDIQREFRCWPTHRRRSGDRHRTRRTADHIRVAQLVPRCHFVCECCRAGV